MAPDATAAADMPTTAIVKTEPIAAAVEKPPAPAASDSDDDFVKVRPRRRRRCIPNISSDNDSRTLDALPVTECPAVMLSVDDCATSRPIDVTDDSSQGSRGGQFAGVGNTEMIYVDDDSQSQTCIEAASCPSKEMVRTVALDGTLAPPLHQLQLAFVDNCDPYNLIKVSEDLIFTCNLCL